MRWWQLAMMLLVCKHRIVNSLVSATSRSVMGGTVRMATTSSHRLSPKAQQFWQSLGSPRHICAPMVDHCYLPWRLLVKRYGADLVYTQMFNSRMMVASETNRRKCIDWLDYECAETAAQDRPLVVQLAGDDPDILCKAGLLLQSRVNAIDLNLGCPQSIAKRGHYGAYLLPERELVMRIVSRLARTLSVPVTVKIRKIEGPDALTVSFAQELEANGCSAVTVHGRTVKQNKQLTGPVSWDLIAQVKAAVTIPVIANGGIGSFGDIARCLVATGADAVMSSEALLENPRLFHAQADAAFRTEYVRTQVAVAKEYLALVQRVGGVENALAARGHLFKLLHRYLCGPANADLRSTMATAQLSGLVTCVETLDKRLQRVQWGEHAASAEGLVGPAHWYMRHRRTVKP